MRWKNLPAQITKRVARLVHGTARALSSRRFVLCTLSLAIALELCVLGVGVVRRLEMSAARTEHAAELYMAAVEAEAFGRQMQERLGGATDISATPDSNKTPQDAEFTGEPGGAPPLPPRDVHTIVFDVTGVSLDDEEIGADSENSGQPAAAETSAVPTDAEGAPLSEEDAVELDRLIRKGVSAMVAGDMRLCVLCLEQAKTISPEHPALLYYYGMAYDKLLNPDKARDYYTRVFSQRDRAGRYFERASRRLTYGLAQPSAMRGKLSFGPPLISHTYDEQTGDSVTMRLPIMLAPDEEVRVEDILIRVRFFVLVNNRKIEFSESYAPQVRWENATQSFATSEENLIVTYELPPLTLEEQGVYGSRRYYGYTAKLYYRGEPLDCLSSPSALILHEQMMDARAATERMRRSSFGGNLLPDTGYTTDDGLVPQYEDDDFAMPADGTAQPPMETATPAADDAASLPIIPNGTTPFEEFINELDPE